jgi:hypothetical protein
LLLCELCAKQKQNNASSLHQKLSAKHNPLRLCSLASFARNKNKTMRLRFIKSLVQNLKLCAFAPLRALRETSKT